MRQAIEVLADIMANSDDQRLRVDVSKFLLEHVVGKPKQKVDIEAGDGLKTIFAGALQMRNIEDGSVVDAHPIMDDE